MSLPLISEIKALHAELEAKDKEIARGIEVVKDYAALCERQSVLLGKADMALADAIEAERDLKQKAFGTSDCLVHSYCEATLRSLQLKGK